MKDLQACKANVRFSSSCVVTVNWVLWTAYRFRISTSTRPNAKVTSNSKFFHSGFTLIEMLVVMALIALISAVAMPTVSSFFQISLNSACRDLGSTVRQASNSTALTGRVHRVVYNMKDNTYWAESGPSDAMMASKESQEREDRKKKFGSRQNESVSDSGFKIETTITRKKMKLPRGVEFEDIITQQSPDPIIEGTAYTHFFPQGVTEQTIIHLKDQSKHHVSLVISAVVGMTDLYDRYVNAAEIFKKE